MGLDAIYNMLAKPVKAGIERARKVQKVTPEAATNADDHQPVTDKPSYQIERRKQNSSRRKFRLGGRRRTDRLAAVHQHEDKFVPATEEELEREARELAQEQQGKLSTGPRDAKGNHVDIEA